MKRKRNGWRLPMGPAQALRDVATLQARRSEATPEYPGVDIDAIHMLPAGVACRVYYCDTVIDVPEPRCPFEVCEAVERKLGLESKEKDERFNFVMKRREA